MNMQPKPVLLVVSFGTSFADAREKNIRTASSFITERSIP